jgi:hypothetical protein
VASAVNASPPELDSLLAELITPEVIYFPLRHHSPACARHLERLLRERRPRSVLIEGPPSFTALLPWLRHPGTRAPFAIYTAYAMPVEDAEPGVPPRRRAAYYPFVDSSPELVAARLGHELGASVRFIDLEFSQQSSSADAVSADRVGSLLSEAHLGHSRFLARLARRAGCRDHNDLWDHLFETRLESSDWSAFVRSVAAWCWCTRSEYSAEALEADGTLARERAMTAAIRSELAQPGPPNSGPVVVVTGGFHTVALPPAVRSAVGPAAPTVAPARPELEQTTCLVRYSFDQLDALNGYASGMPAPFYYDRLWHASGRPERRPDGGSLWGEVAAQWLVESGQLSRRAKNAHSVSVSDLIAALQQARQLAALRGHPGPTREDLLDGVRSCLVKGATDAEGAVILDLAQHALTGNRVGEVPAEAGAPPLVEDFRRQAQRLRLKLGDSVSRPSALELYRKTAHRQISRFLHSLVHLQVPFAVLGAGPDFVRGTGLERMIEHWEYRWSPATESQLVEASVWGATVEEAAATRLRRLLAELEEQGRGRQSGLAVELLIQACRLGLHAQVSQLVDLIQTQVEADPSFVSVVQAAAQLRLLWESREPLEAHRLPQIPEVQVRALRRACYLLPNLSSTPEQEAEATLEALQQLQELLSRENAQAGAQVSADLFWEPLRGWLALSGASPLLTGGAAGLLYRAGQIDEAETLRCLVGHLQSTAPRPESRLGFLVGLLRTARELAWQAPALSRAVGELLEHWSDDEFHRLLPQLRLAFSVLTPAETDQVAGVVAPPPGEGARLDWYRPDLAEEDLVWGRQLRRAVEQALRQDGLEAWP